MAQEKAFRRLQNLGFKLVPKTPSQLSSVDCAHLDNVTEAPPNLIFGLRAEYEKDSHPDKMLMVMGVYRTWDGKPYVLPVVRKAEALILADNMDHEYLPISGHVPFCQAAQELIFGGNHKRISSVQGISGTGSLRVGAAFLKQSFPKNDTIYIPSPSWGNHKGIYSKAGLKPVSYRYWDDKTRGLDLEGMLADLRNAPAKSLVLLHAVAHNPTGVDPTQEDWKKIYEVIKAKDHFVIFDSAYQGFASGSLEADSFSIRYFYNGGLKFMVNQSFAKNMGLYNERIGAIHVVTESASQAKAVSSRIKLLIRPMYSNPPAHGARIAHRILTTPHLREEWKVTLREMSERISDTRPMLRSRLEKLGTPGTWKHLTDQIGMFSFTGLSKPQCEAILKKHHVYMLPNGRISMCGIEKGNVDYLAKCIDDVVRND